MYVGMCGNCSTINTTIIIRFVLLLLSSLLLMLLPFLTCVCVNTYIYICVCVCASPPHPTDHRGEDHFDMAVGEDSWNPKKTF